MVLFCIFGGWGVSRANFEKYHGTFLYFFCSFGQISSKFLQNFFKYSSNFLYFLFNIFSKFSLTFFFNIFLQYFFFRNFFNIFSEFLQNFFKNRGVGCRGPIPKSTMVLFCTFLSERKGTLKFPDFRKVPLCSIKKVPAPPPVVSLINWYSLRYQRDYIITCIFCLIDFNFIYLFLRGGSHPEQYIVPYLRGFKNNSFRDGKKNGNLINSSYTIYLVYENHNICYLE